METGKMLKRQIRKHLSETGAKWTPETGWTNVPVARDEQETPERSQVRPAAACDLEGEWRRLSESLLEMARKALVERIDASTAPTAILCLDDAYDLHTGGSFRSACLRCLHSMSYTLGVHSLRYRTASTLYHALTPFNK